MYKKGETTGSNKANRLMTEKYLEVRLSLSRVQEELLFDPQTSGGLLLAVPDAEAAPLIAALHDKGVQVAIKVGEVTAGAPGIMIV